MYVSFSFWALQEAVALVQHNQDAEMASRNLIQEAFARGVPTTLHASLYGLVCRNKIQSDKTCMKQ